MKRAEDFRDAFGPMDAGFEESVRETLRELKIRETQETGRKRRGYMIPAIAAALALLIGIGIAASAITGKRGYVLEWLTENRSPGANVTEQPAATDPEEPTIAQVDMEYAMITVREAVNDGYGLYLAVAFTPKDDDTLVFGRWIDPYKDRPEEIGFASDEKAQTIAQWAAKRGYKRMISVALVSMPEWSNGLPNTLSDDELAAWLDEQGIRYRRDLVHGGIIFDKTLGGASIDSYLNSRMITEEDGTALIMAAGSSAGGGKDEYPLTWTAAINYTMNENGTWKKNALDSEAAAWRQGKIFLRIPVTGSGTEEILADYTGEVPAMNDSGEMIPVSMRLIRTGLNDYYQIRVADTGRAFQSPLPYLESSGENPPEPFAESDIYSYSVREQDGTLIYTRSCRVPEELPDSLMLRWVDKKYEKKITLQRMPSSDL